MSEPRTGRILGLANWPTFDLNLFWDAKAAPMDSQRNRAVSDVYEPGSVFKIVSIAGAFEEHLITPNSVYDCGATQVPYKGRMVSLPADSHALGVVDIRTIVRESSNRGTVQVGMLYAERQGEDRFFGLIKSFGFGAPSGLITGAEVPGLLISPQSNQWASAISRIPMGHSVSVTAMQMHYAMSVIAADGLLMQPQLVLRVEDPKTRQVVLAYPPRSRGGPSAPAPRASSPRCYARSAARAAPRRSPTSRATRSRARRAPPRRSSTASIRRRTTWLPSPVSSPWATRAWPSPSSSTNPRARASPTAARSPLPIFREVAEKCIRWLDLPPVSPR